MSQSSTPRGEQRGHSPAVTCTAPVLGQRFTVLTQRRLKTPGLRKAPLPDAPRSPDSNRRCLPGCATQTCHRGVLFLGRPSLGAGTQPSPIALRRARLCSHGAGRAATGNEGSGGAVLLLGDTANTAGHRSCSVPSRLCPCQLLLGDARLQEGGFRRHLAWRGAGLSSEPLWVGFRRTLRVPPGRVCAVQLAVASWWCAFCEQAPAFGLSGAQLSCAPFHAHPAQSETSALAAASGPHR